MRPLALFLVGLLAGPFGLYVVACIAARLERIASLAPGRGGRPGGGLPGGAVGDGIEPTYEGER